MKFIDKKALTAEDLAALEVEVQAMEILSSHSNFVRLYDFFAEKVCGRLSERGTAPRHTATCVLRVAGLFLRVHGAYLWGRAL